MLANLDNFARMRLSQTESPAGKPEDWRKCAKEHKAKYKDVDPTCKISFISLACQIENFCRLCKQFSVQKFSEERKAYFDGEIKRCARWIPEMTHYSVTSCPEIPAGHNGSDDDHSPKSSSFFSSTAGIIVVAVVVIVVIAIGGLISWCMCCSSDRGDGGGRAVGKSKGNKSAKSKGGKSIKAKSAKG